jgi:hypothetical protein
MADSPSPDELKQLQADLPSLGELKQLPLRALVAYAARNARRVQPFFTLPDDHPEKQRHVAAVERAIRIAEEFAKGTPVADADTWLVVPAAAGAVGGPSAAGAAWVATDTARAAIFATKPAKSEPDFFPETGELILWPEGTCANEAWAAYWAWSAAAMSATAADARSDFDKLRGLGLGRFPALGEPIDSSGEGPLGPLGPRRRAEPLLTPRKGEVGDKRS